MTLPLELNP